MSNLHAWGYPHRFMNVGGDKNSDETPNKITNRLNPKGGNPTNIAPRNSQALRMVTAPEESACRAYAPPASMSRSTMSLKVQPAPRITAEPIANNTNR